MLASSVIRHPSPSSRVLLKDDSTWLQEVLSRLYLSPTQSILQTGLTLQDVAASAQNEAMWFPEDTVRGAQVEFG